MRRLFRSVQGWPFYRKLAFLSLGFFVLIFGAFFHYSTSPSFCRSCHIMEPYYQAWKTSKHNFVSCVDCHNLPGMAGKLRGKWEAMTQFAKFLTDQYGSKPFAEIDDASCLQSACHNTRLLQGKETFKKGILFDHVPHLTETRRGIKLRCTSCHSQIVIGTHIEVTEGTCFLCHFKGRAGERGEAPLGGCPSCHLPPEKEIQVGGVKVNHRQFIGQKGVPCGRCHMDTTAGEGNVTQDRCFNCHNQPEKLERFSDYQTLHLNHITRRKVECERCHEEIRHSAVTSMTAAPEHNCSSCHQGMHSAPGELYQGRGARGVEEMSDPMFKADVDCVGCHVVPKRGVAQEAPAGQTFTASRLSCVSCHGTKYDGYLATFTPQMDRMLSYLERRLRRVEAQLAKAPRTGTGTREGFRLARDARHNWNLVFWGRGVHNPHYALAALRTARDYLEPAERALGLAPPPGELPAGFSRESCALVCHAGLPMPEEAATPGGTLPHRRHARSVQCSSCHQVSPHEKQPARVNADCDGCHHGRSIQQASSCEACHRDQAIFYHGTLKELPEGVQPSANIMESTVDCLGCHDPSQPGKTSQKVSARCVACHEESYAALLQDWMAPSSEARILLVRAQRLEARHGRRPSQEGARALALLSEARHLASIVVAARSAHNAELAEVLVKKAGERLQQAEALLGRP